MIDDVKALQQLHIDNVHRLKMSTVVKCFMVANHTNNEAAKESNERVRVRQREREKETRGGWIPDGFSISRPKCVRKTAVIF